MIKKHFVENSFFVHILYFLQNFSNLLEINHHFCDVFILKQNIRRFALANLLFLKFYLQILMEYIYLKINQTIKTLIVIDKILIKNNNKCKLNILLC